MTTSNRTALAFMCISALLGCSESVDSRTNGLPVYQNGAAPVAPWKLVDDGAGTGDDQPIAPDTNGVVNPGGMQGGAGATSMMVGTGGMTGGMGTTGTGGMGVATGTGGMGVVTGTGGTGMGTGGKTGGTGGMGMGTGTGGSMEPETGAMPTMVTFDVTTVAQGGRYQPKNIGAIWVEDSSGTYVKTLEVWAGIRARYLSRWLSGNTWGDQTDAVSSATLRMHMTHHATWDLTDTNGKTVPDGAYTIYVESTDADRTGANTSIKFTKGPKAQTEMPSDAMYFKSLKLAYQ